jgi:hypothetical protein
VEPPRECGRPLAFRQRCAVAQEPDNWSLRRLLRSRRERPRGRCAKKGDELTPLIRSPRRRSVMKSRRFMSDIGLFPGWRRRSVYRTLNLPQGGPQVLGAKLKCSESRRWPAPHCASNQARIAAHACAGTRFYVFKSGQRGAF